MNKPFSYLIFVLLLSHQLFATNTLDQAYLENMDLDAEGLTVAQALDILQQAKGQKIEWKASGIGATTSFISGAILEILGGVGVSFSCPERSSNEALSILCAFSAAGVGLGGLFLVAAIGIPAAVLVYNHNINVQNNPNDNLCSLFQEIASDRLLSEENFPTFINIIKSNPILLLEAQNSFNDHQRSLFEQISVHQEGFDENKNI